MVEKFLVIEQVPASPPRIKGFLKSDARSEKKWYRHDNSHLSHFSSVKIKGETSEFQTTRWRPTSYLLKDTDVVYRDP